MVELKTGTWVVVTDSEKALFMRNITDHDDPNLSILETEVQENPPTREQGATQAGRRADGGPGQRSAMEGTDWHELAKERFAKDLSDILYQKAHKGEFKALVIVAAPQILGVLRAEMHRTVTEKIVAEIPKNMAGHPVDKIEKLIKSELDAMGSGN
ncbi:host attachment family protein [Aestuariivita sp.]|uniref:host attachment family protein n=1 Tax=Aestuariivita sp. TaxID=1872407 RepID=UPI00216E3F6D|nr:host attachment family protein [Aestuariivita sp.]MCE8006664.1 host attachment protein [Aestuariivita sp.]